MSGFLNCDVIMSDRKCDIKPLKYNKSSHET